MTPNSLDEYAAAVTACVTTDELFALYRAEMEAEGFQNISFLKYSPSGDHEIPFLELPSGFPGVYLAENLADDDPVFVTMRQTSRPFTWADMMIRCDWHKPARNVMSTCRDLKVHGGLSIPFHGPNGQCDVFGLSYRDKRTIDPARLSLVTLKTFTCWYRYQDIEAANAVLSLAGLTNSVASKPRREKILAHAAGPAGISAQECRALVIVDVSDRRYRSGLTELNDKIPQVVGEELFGRLLTRGLIYDEPDDERWRFYSRPSPIGRAHLKKCPSVTAVREQIWRLHVRKDERPSA